MPEPLLGEQAQEIGGQAELEDSLSMAFLVLLESLTPVERVLFLLREVFDYEYAEIASLVVLLTTYKRDVRRSAPLSTSRWGDLAYFRTWDTAWKLRRIRNNPRVQFAPSTARGKPTAPPIWARARVLEGEDSAHAGRLLASKYPALHGLLVLLVHRLRGNKTMHVELTPAEAWSQTTSAPSGSPRRA